MTDEYRPVPLDFRRLPAEEQMTRARDFTTWMRRRRTVRSFSPEPVAYELIEAAIAVAASAPSGANRQPWTLDGSGDADPHPEPHGVSGGDPETAKEREALSPSPRRLPCARGACARY